MINAWKCDALIKIFELLSRWHSEVSVLKENGKGNTHVTVGDGLTREELYKKNRSEFSDVVIIDTLH